LESLHAEGQEDIFAYRGATLLEKGWAVQIYENGKPISSPYTVTHETAIDYSTAGWGHAVEALMHAAQIDVEEEHLPEVKKLFHPN
jgi:glycine/serine hydroxymethyltransferase